ncbi:MAG: phosphoribosylformylglycinamidine cyclo-ligase [Gammaproteobacteria bacterium]|nr:phosphoribosylformylglycinamidine cyclo-ligase [Gammaproteobacteria bacterium]
MKKVDYKAAGVDIDAGNAAVLRIKQHVESTFNPAVLTPLGSFAAMYDLQNIFNDYRHPVLVQSIDGVGTKIMVAQMMQKFDTIGMDLVSATTNDIVVLGAKPLTLLDYIANDHLQPDIIEQIVKGMAEACKENNIALVGGETAEMPGTYRQNEHDLVGIITGVVEKDKAILGKNIKPNDIVFGLPSSGLHTNGYSLARKLFFEVGQYQVDTYLPELQKSVGEALLVPHLNYNRIVQFLLQEKIELKGMAHISGGGLLENIPRILPPGCQVEINKNAWPSLPVFNVLQHLGKQPVAEMYRTFNMGIGMVLIVSPDQVARLETAVQTFSKLALYQIGEVMAGPKQVRMK